MDKSGLRSGGGSMNAVIWPRLQVIMSDVLAIVPTQVTGELSPETIENWDSLNHLKLTLALEQEFKVNFLPEDIEQLTSAQRISDILERKLN
jgi:acyl carrier protein